MQRSRKERGGRSVAGGHSNVRTRSDLLLTSLYHLDDEALFKLLAATPAVRERGLVGASTQTDSASLIAVESPAVSATFAFASPSVSSPVVSTTPTTPTTPIPPAPPSPRVRGKFGETPLMVATVLRSTRVVRLVLERAPEDIHVKDKSGTTALMLAAMKGNTRKVDLLVEAGAGSGLHVRDRSEKSALVHALEHGHVGLLDVLVPAMVQSGNPAGNEELIAVLLRTIRGKAISLPVGPLEMQIPVLILEAIKRAAMANSRLSPSSSPPSFSAVLRQPLTVVHACLVECAYNVLTAMADGYERDGSVASMVLRFACGCGKGCDEEAKRICHGLDACADAYGVLPLDGGARCGDVDGAKGVDWVDGEKVADARTRGIDLIKMACRHPHPSPAVIRKLFQMNTRHIGADAASFGLIELMKTYDRNPQAMLQEWYGGSPPSMDATWTSPRFLQCIHALLENGADVVTEDQDGLTAMALAVMNMNVEVITYVLSHCLAKIRSLYGVKLARRSDHCPGELARMSRYAVDIDDLLLAAVEAAEARLNDLERMNAEHVCPGCIINSHRGMRWVLRQWSMGSPPDMRRYREVLHQFRTARGALHFGPCPVLDIMHTENDVREEEEDEEDGAGVSPSFILDSSGTGDTDEDDDADEEDDEEEDDERDPKNRWYASFI